ncbi:permease [Curvivirga sp.]|uniref:permease n=1 Tax=Curvivirga sp. TaxID=2856848 RepID=UPI003B5B2B37
MLTDFILSLPLGEWGPMVAETVGMFLFIGTELTLLFLIISFIVGVIQEFLPAEKIQSILSSKSGKGYFSAALLGSVTPFCSCSTIPMLTGLLKAKAGFGPTLVFLFTSPLLNPIIIGLFWATFGLKVTIAYALIALLVSLVSAYLLENFKFDRFVKEEVFSDKGVGGCKSSCAEPKIEVTQNSCVSKSCTPSDDVKVEVNSCGAAVISDVSDNRWLRIWKETWSQFLKVLPYLAIGVAIGSMTYGFMPADIIADYAGADNPLAVPIAAVIGVPLYVRAEAVIPLSAALAAKGMGMGAVMALIIGSAGASITEVILLKSMFKRQMIIAFLSVIFGMAILAGFLFNIFF